LPVRIALLDLPQLMSEIVKDILDQADDIAVVEASERGDADVVIIAADRDDLPAVGQTQLKRRATARVITITAEGRTGYLYELRPHRTPLGEVSADSLLAAIRTRAADWA
jgi:hypothetical protein